jgi:Condensation domain/TubC N-terminal docking domain
MLLQLRHKGARIWEEKGQLRYQARQGALTSSDLEELRRLKPDILALLRQSSLPADKEPPLRRRATSDVVPLAFSQQWLWNHYDLATRTSLRSIVGTAHIRGKLNLQCLQRSVEELYQRHEALRTRIIVLGGVARQDIFGAPGTPPLEWIDLITLPAASRGVEARQLVNRLAHEPVRVAVDRLFHVGLIRLEEDRHVLCMALDHIISDAASLQILMRDLFSLYVHSGQGISPAVAEVPFQFADYAVWQRTAQPSWTALHQDYWTKRLAGAKRVRLFAQRSTSERVAVHWAIQPIHFGASLSTALRQLSRRARTTLVMTVLAVYATLLFRWCHTTDIVVLFTTSGRGSADLDNTVGFFGTQLPVRIEVAEGDSFLDLLTRVTREYSTAHEHHDAGRLMAQLPSPDFAPNPIFNWIPRELDGSGSGRELNAGRDGLLRVEERRVEISPRDDFDWKVELALLLSDTGEEVAGFLHYRADLCTPNTVSRLERNLAHVAQSVVRAPTNRLTSLRCLE